jgi:hypothetical protein
LYEETYTKYCAFTSSAFCHKGIGKPLIVIPFVSNQNGRHQKAMKCVFVDCTVDVAFGVEALHQVNGQNNRRKGAAQVLVKALHIVMVRNDWHSFRVKIAQRILEKKGRDS